MGPESPVIMTVIRIHMTQFGIPDMLPYSIFYSLRLLSLFDWKALFSHLVKAWA